MVTALSSALRRPRRRSVHRLEPENLCSPERLARRFPGDAFAVSVLVAENVDGRRRGFESVALLLAFRDDLGHLFEAKEARLAERRAYGVNL